MGIKYDKVHGVIKGNKWYTQKRTPLRDYEAIIPPFCQYDRNSEDFSEWELGLEMSSRGMRTLEYSSAA